jgi:hypothetical protein
MPAIKISKIKARRGTNDQRKTIIFDQGELAFTTDTNRFYVGNGLTYGGISIGNKIHYPPLTNVSALTTIQAEVGDITPVNTSFYQLTTPNYLSINSWTKIPQLSADPIVFNFDVNGTLVLNNNSISAKHINSQTVSNGLVINSGILETNFQTKSLEISAFKLSLKPSGIDEREINTTSFINGLSGGSGNKIGLNVNPTQFTFNDGVLSAIPYILNFSELKPEWFGAGLVYSLAMSSLSTNLVNVDNQSLIKSDSGIISLSTLNSSGSNQLPNITVDTFGRVINHNSSIYSTLSGNSALSSYNSNNSLSSIFNGTPSHSVTGAIPGLEIVKFTAHHTDGSVVTLSSAGFITFEGNTTTRTGQIVGRFAIPIFTY